MHEVKLFIRDLELNYKKIDACPNDCMLYPKEFENFENCIRCSRWNFERKVNIKSIPTKVLRHFPLIPRLQQLFMCSKVCTDRTWYEDHCLKDGKLCHLADIEQQKSFNVVNLEFTFEPQNVRLGLASDEFNLFGSMLYRILHGQLL